jgi:hypothetical protein
MEAYDSSYRQHTRLESKVFLPAHLK